MGSEKERVKMRNRSGVVPPRGSATIAIDLRQIGERLKKAREEQGLTQEQLGREVGVTRAAISQWEAGQVEATLSKLGAAAKRLETNLGRLLTGEEPRPARARGRAPSGAVPAVDGIITEMVDGDGMKSAAADDWWRLPPSVLRNLLCNPVGAKIFHMRGASMEPTINRGAYILVDVSQNTPHDGQVYVINNGISFVVKRLHIHRSAKDKQMVDLSADSSTHTTTLPISRVKIVGLVIAQLARPL
jgi:transcriptional regulator with XRE-family HTH domain